MAFLGGLNNSALLRLKFTKALVGKKYLESLESLEKEMSCESSYKTYRELLHNTDPPCVPYIGVYLTDLTFIEEGNPNIIGNNLINFSKYTLLYKVISEVQQYQWSEYNLNYVPIIQTFIKDLNSPTVAELYQVSLQKEPKGAQKSDIF
ncbi:Ras guanine nucleotide exchange factor [Heterostelium album PN500]|uniref:Ras guanine nucleotide exchange factor n=1 Tax=Heterostelium pallidum (strain ATCC 26659 / Pp 5 / PN500) TaxID=670386 RepID=D3BF19_HETP5|nr:Ras guanine nucleotide exchange factor [Heterostelium album PN500]EFA80500.1 Ras guanine nucleotide exchange factor [Heterostelium album PN500]|eukprot:XP_020432620.1 Ras guanine nucleotide exchange factor [Heterostelium album PN500]